MKRAIDKLKQLAEDNNKFANEIETGEVKIIDTPIERVESLIRTYRYWGQCLSMAAWLLENEEHTNK